MCYSVGNTEPYESYFHQVKRKSMLSGPEPHMPSMGMHAGEHSSSRLDRTRSTRRRPGVSS